MSTDQNVLIPIKLDAFILNDRVCDGGPLKAKIAPITQPNYTFLRLDNSYLQPDITYNVDLHSVSGAEVNSRITDLGTGKPRENRRGVYLHWTIPRIYRSGTADAEQENAASEGLPNFPEAPARWLVVRHIDDMAKVEPADARSALQPVTAWVVESDRCRTIDGPRDHRGNLVDSTNILPNGTDLQVDAAPFVDANAQNSEGKVIEKQAEIFIGEKILASEWEETASDKAKGPKDRIELRLMSSSNELFPDFQPQCSNVFSIVDNFEYRQDPTTGAPLYATAVQASYSVIGWNWRSSVDIMNKKNRQGRFNQLNLKIKGFQEEADPMAKYPKQIADWFGTGNTVTRSVCHGAMYGVSWDLNSAPKNILADRFAKVLAEAQPVSIGTTPMDAIMAYAGAHEGIKGQERGRIEAALKRLETILLSRDDGVEAHMQATDMLYNWNYSRFDGGDCFFAAASGDQTKAEPGKEKKKEPLKLSPEKQATLSELNRLSRLRDAAKRRIKEQEWNAFSLWWLAVTQAKTNTEIQAEVEKISKNIPVLRACRDDSQKRMDELLSGLKPSDALPPTPPNKDEVKDFEPGVLDPYQQQRDPTLLVGGITPGWEIDYLLALLVRLDCQVIQPTHGDDAPWQTFFDGFVDKKLPIFMRETVKALLREFVAMKSRRGDKDDGHPKQPSKLQEQGLMNAADFKPFGEDWHLYINSEPPRPALAAEIPLYHDRLGRSYDDVGANNKGEDEDEDQPPPPGVWRDLWNDTQPWFPLFLEWEVEYFHIKHNDWELKETRWWEHEGVKLHYNIREGHDLATDYKESPDRRPFAGRALILPQPSFTLENKVIQLLTDTLPSELDKILGKEERKYLVKNLNKLQFLSSPLSGFNSHLQTVDQGNHVKPGLRNPDDGSLKFLKEAYRKDAGFDETNIKLMGLETDVTPYGAMKKPILGEDKNGPSSFKPVTHGQFKLTKVNIVDKFGQVINLLDPRPLPYKPKEKDIPRAWPCLSDWYAPGAKAPDPTDPKHLVPNTVEEAPLSEDGKHKPHCEFAQVPPQINQPARLNAAWVVPNEPLKLPPKSGILEEDPIPSSPPPFWRAASEWDSPIWGWVVVNYANYGLQFFLPSGAFYREVRAGGPSGAMESPDWLPFTQPDDPNKHGKDQDGGPMAKQLARLVKTIAGNSGYLKSFIAMINAATTSTGTSAPSAYAEFKSALIGKPLALVNMGFSLELSGPAQTSQLMKDPKPEKALYKDVVTKEAPGPGCEKNDEYDKEYYRFPIKLGDAERGFDGMVCYFKPKEADKLEIGDALDLSTMFTHFGPNNPYFKGELGKVTPRPQTYMAGSGHMDDPYKYITTIGGDNYPKLPPYYIDPLVADSKISTSLGDQDYEDLTNGQLAVFGAIVDPFSPVHGYMGVMPVKELKLPDWTWQGPIDQISAFFHAGPVLVTWDVPKFDEKNQLTQGKLIPKIVDKKKGEHGVALPGGSLGQWTWLQPYMEDPEASKPPPPPPEQDNPSLRGGGDVEPPPVKEPEPLERFMPVGVDLVDDMAHLERGPYTALEGYLQMASGAVQD
ncbi:unnamed protein product [Clonostachys rosea]|uniref:Uncharacterized protein n=1 Tax=Bionectria ochroleuca TaxID=29856 RepID=A0ABY6U4S2_BIOOC|nr:unnamed protein product [Clonostachys rosea]